MIINRYRYLLHFLSYNRHRYRLGFALNNRHRYRYQLEPTFNNRYRYRLEFNNRSISIEVTQRVLDMQLVLTQWKWLLIILHPKENMLVTLSLTVKSGQLVRFQLKLKIKQMNYKLLSFNQLNLTHRFSRGVGWMI